MQTEQQVQQKPQMQIMQVIQQTAPTQIAELDFVKNKFVENYNLCHKEKVGELMYHRQVVHFKQQIAASEQLKKADPFSLYACFLTAAVKGYSLDPEDSEVYLYTMGNKAVLKRQAGAHVRRLMETGQIKYAEQPKLVYQGDELEVVNGRVVKHIEKFQSEIIIAGYVRFVLNAKGDDRYYIYRKSDWEAWKQKSPQKAADNWTGNGGQPGAAFLRTKIIKHAATDKSWATGSTNPNAELYAVEIDEDDEKQQLPDANGTFTPTMVVTPTGQMQGNDDDFAQHEEVKQGNGIVHDDDEF